MRRTLASILLAALPAVLAPTGAVRAQGVEDMPPPRSLEIFPYAYVDYTQEGHDYRLWNTQAVVLGTIQSMRQIEGTEKLLDRSVTLRVESFLKMDRPWLQEDKKEIRFRCLPLQAPYDDMREGDRCVVFLVRDRRFDDALILPTDYHYYPVTEDGVVRKFFKDVPTSDAPVLREVGLSDFLRWIRSELQRISVEGQARNAELVFTGTVRHVSQGKGPLADYMVTEIAVEKLLKGGGEKDVVRVHSLNNMERWTLATLNGPVFRRGEKVCIFANKDPTLSAAGPANPDGETRWKLYNGRQSAWDVHPRTVWRNGVWPIKTDEFFKTIEEQVSR